MQHKTRLEAKSHGKLISLCSEGDWIQVQLYYEEDESKDDDGSDEESEEPEAN